MGENNVDIEAEPVMSYLFVNKLDNELSLPFHASISASEGSRPVDDRLKGDKLSMKGRVIVEVSYKIPYDMDGIEKLSLRFRLPRIKSRIPGYQIAWPCNLVNAIVKEVTMVIPKGNDKTTLYCTFGTEVNNKITSFDINLVDVPQVEASLGNKPHLTEFTSELPEDVLTCNINVPFYNDKSPFALLYHAGGVKVKCKLMLQFVDLVRMKSSIENQSEMHYGPVSLEHIQCTQNGKDQVSVELPVLQVVGRKFADKGYVEYYLKECFRNQTTGELTNKVNIEYYDYHVISSKNEVRSEKVKEINIKDVKELEGRKIVEIAWMAENLRASRINNHCNYTTNYLDAKQGDDPIQGHKIVIGNENIALTNDMFPWLYQNKTRCYPRVKGYHKYFIGLDEKSLDKQPYIVINNDLKQFKLELSLGNSNNYIPSDPFSSDVSASSNGKILDIDTYIIHVILKYKRTLTYYYDAESGTVKFDID